MSSRTTPIVESVNATARVGALFLSVLLFVAMWESDAPVTPQQHWLAQRAGVPLPAAPAPRVSAASSSAVSAVAASPAPVGRSSVSAPAGPVGSPGFLSVSLRPVPVAGSVVAGSVEDGAGLPPGIAPGRYRVVDSRGTVSSITVRQSTAGSRRDIQPRDFYTTRQGNLTRYFIRIDAAATEGTTGSRWQL